MSRQRSLTWYARVRGSLGDSRILCVIHDVRPCRCEGVLKSLLLILRHLNPGQPC